jgi:hypothetical protein
MSNRTVPFTSTVEELDNLLFKVIVASFTAMYPNDGRMALKAAMHMADKLTEEMESHAAKQAKSAQARAAAQARYSAPATAQATQTRQRRKSPAAPAAPPAPETRPQNKAELAAAAAAAAHRSRCRWANRSARRSAPHPRRCRRQHPGIPSGGAAAEAPVVSDFATLAQQAATQMPQFARRAGCVRPARPAFG